MVAESRSNPPLYLDLPVKDGKVRPEIVAKWAANAPLTMVDQYVAEPEPSIIRSAIEIGTKDPCWRRIGSCTTR